MSSSAAAGLSLKEALCWQLEHESSRTAILHGSSLARHTSRGQETQWQQQRSHSCRAACSTEPLAHETLLSPSFFFFFSIRAATSGGATAAWKSGAEQNPGKGEGEERGKTWSCSDRKLRLFAGQPSRGGRIYSEPEAHNHWVHFYHFYFEVISPESDSECASETRDRPQKLLESPSELIGLLFFFLVFFSG